jgi:hypothetical protein
VLLRGQRGTSVSLVMATTTIVLGHETSHYQEQLVGREWLLQDQHIVRRGVRSTL